MEILNLESYLPIDIKSEQCGTIFYSEKLKYFISCINCSEKFFDIKIFSAHFDEQHLICTNSDPLVSIITSSTDCYTRVSESENPKSICQTQPYSNDENEGKNLLISDKLKILNNHTNNTNSSLKDKVVALEQDVVEINSVVTPNTENYSEDNFINPIELKSDKIIIPKNLRTKYLYSCEICDQHFVTLSALKTHRKRKHLKSQAQKHDCGPCGKIFEAKKNLSAHTIVHSKNKKTYVCSICSDNFLMLSALKRHIKSSHVDTRDFVCKVCNTDFESKYEVDEHIRRIHKNAYNDDQTYGKSNKDKSTMAPNISKKDGEIVHGDDNIKLNKSIVKNLVKISHEKLIKPNELQREIKTLYTCKLCSKKFNTLTCLHSHRVKKHSLQSNMKPMQQRRNITANRKDARNSDISPLHTEMKFTCKVCSSKFFLLSALQRHINIFHAKKTDFFCRYCKKYFETKVVLEIHSKKYHSDYPETPFKCPICCELFSTRQTFRQHYKLKHTQKEKKPHKCSFCDKFFKFTHDKIIHERTHTKETFAVCEYCGLSFITISGLNAHRRRRHSKELNLKIEKQEHKCLTCGKVYKHKSYLAEHSVVHSKIRKYVCSICSESFAWSYVLRRHVMNVHNDSRDFVCKVCEKDFKSKSKVAEHIKKTHKITFNNDLFYKKLKDEIEVKVK